MDERAETAGETPSVRELLAAAAAAESDPTAPRRQLDGPAAG